jgi:hypothetical protein
MKVALAAVLASLSLSATALAQTPRQTPKPPAPVALHFDEGDLIEGTLQKPDGDDITIRRGVRFESLIRLRSEFSDKLMHSAANL